MVENGSASPHELVKALKRYPEESGETERSAASRIGVNRRTLHRWSELLDSLPLSLRLHTPA